MKNAVLVAVSALVFVTASAADSKGPASPPRARDVVVRGGSDLADLIARATARGWEDETKIRSIAVVVDATTHTREAREEIADAFKALGKKIGHLRGTWRVGPLGGALSPSLRHPTAVPMVLDKVFAKDTPQVNTLRALRTTLRDFPDRGGLVLYLADWRFEDEHDLEGFISFLRRRNQALSVIGSEACFERGWNDGFPEFGGFEPEYLEGIGRSPFGPQDPKAPWHGGDTAYPHIPWSFGSLPWRTEFPAHGGLDGGLDGGLEDLLDRVRAGGSVSLERSGSGSGSGFGTYPLPSGFGPYALMRAAGETGGRYHLYSFNPSGRANVTYHFSRLNQFPPDLRPRRDILPDTRRRPVASALLRAWHLLAEPASGVVDVTPPLTRSGRPAEMECVKALGTLPLYWPEKSDHRRFLHRADSMSAALGQAIEWIDRATTGHVARDDVDARYGADAALLRHTLAVLRFEVDEAVAVARTVPKDAWDDEDAVPGLTTETWIRPSKEIQYGPGRPKDAEAASAIEKERVEHLRRFGGTPFGALVEKNAVEVWRLDKAPSLSAMQGDPRTRTPSETEGPEPTTPEPPPTTPGAGPGAPGGSSGGGPSTGR